jgi:hypothetical protein
LKRRRCGRYRLWVARTPVPDVDSGDWQVSLNVALNRDKDLERLVPVKR